MPIGACPYVQTKNTKNFQTTCQKQQPHRPFLPSRKRRLDWGIVSIRSDQPYHKWPELGKPGKQLKRMKKNDIKPWIKSNQLNQIKAYQIKRYQTPFKLGTWGTYSGTTGKNSWNGWRAISSLEKAHIHVPRVTWRDVFPGTYSCNAPGTYSCEKKCSWKIPIAEWCSRRSAASRIKIAHTIMYTVQYIIPHNDNKRQCGPVIMRSLRSIKCPRKKAGSC